MSNEKKKAMNVILELMEIEEITLLDFMAFNMEKVMINEGTDLCDIPSVLHGLCRNIVGALSPE